MTLLRSKRSNRFCGPAALSLIAGIHVDDAARTLRAVSHKRAIKGASSVSMLAAFDRLGYRTRCLIAGAPKGTARPTLAQALEGPPLGCRGPSERLLVIVTGHYVVIEGQRLFDNKHPQGIPLALCPYRRKRVRAAWTVERRLPPSPPPPPRLNADAFARAIEALGLVISGCPKHGYSIAAPDGFAFASGLSAISVRGRDYQGPFERIRAALPLVAVSPYCV